MSYDSCRWQWVPCLFHRAWLGGHLCSCDEATEGQGGPQAPVSFPTTDRDPEYRVLSPGRRLGSHNAGPALGPLLVTEPQV